ncbi:MAG: hypothetical protein KME10_08900 [Plectolyngbya sp. WJT66-NPBG17]|jgi:hypothetical protein|nr:hypothetical protein [Plectolyngbya sp. WJT66-NPBG17]MBW4524279.1 hypothetical protein [Phormidium tanganyikae FI6-MK23]
MKGFHKIFQMCASGTLISLLILCTGCTAVPFFGSLQNPTKTELSMQVSPTGEAGVYQITGHTNLPDQTQLTIQAVRNLQPPKLDSQAESEQTYSILARTQVKVEKGKWDTSLNLLQPSQQGKFESWQQTSRSLNLKSQPENQVRFLATTDPTKNSIELQQQSTTAGTQSASIQFAADGKSYLQAEQFLTIEPPVVKLAASQNPGQTLVKVAVQPISKATNVKSQTDADLPAKGWMR